MFLQREGDHPKVLFGFSNVSLNGISKVIARQPCWLAICAALMFKFAEPLSLIGYPTSVWKSLLMSFNAFL